MRTWIDLNADLGEGCGDDAEIMQIVTSCNIACGGHAGDAESMSASLALAKLHGVAAGAHPSYPDHKNFGRKAMELSGADLKQSLLGQVRALKQLAEDMGIAPSHLKPHGALYNHAAKDAETARVIAGVTAETLPGAALVGPPGSQLEAMAQAAGIGFIGEGFADRAYEANGALRDRSKQGAVLATDEARIAQALQIATAGEVFGHTGETVIMPASTICLHSDTPGALASARLIREALETKGIEVKAPA